MKKQCSILLGVLVTFCWLGSSCKKEEYVLREITINGTPLEEYTLVYDAKDKYSKYCADNLSALFFDIAGLQLQTVSDTQAEKTHEILIGKTNRSASSALENIVLDENEYICSAENGKLLLYANAYMVGGAANYLVNECILSSRRGDKALATLASSNMPISYSFETPENVILMIGDGMGENHIEMAKQEAVFDVFYAESMPNRGKVATYSYSVFESGATYTDSAAAATALATGYKTKNGYVGVDHSGNKVKNIRELAQEKGARTAVLTTDALTGATPASFMAHHSRRGATAELQSQIVYLQATDKITVAEGNLEHYFLEAITDTLQKISRGNGKFFAMIEEGHIDKYSHDTSVFNACRAVSRLNDAVAYAMQFTLMHPNTVLIVTADHETGGIQKNKEDCYVYTTGNHTNADVPVFAMGMGTEKLAKNRIDNIEIAKFIADIYGEDNFGGKSLFPIK